MSPRSVLLIAIMLGVAATASTAFAQAVYYGEEPMEMAPSGPPPDQTEAPPPPPHETAFWKPGYWKVKHGKWEWIPGHYIERPAPAATWVPGHYVYRSYGYVYVPGYWL